MELATLLDCPRRVEVTLCSICGSELVQSRWQPSTTSVEDLIYNAAEGAIGIHKDLKDPKVTLTLQKVNSSQYSVSAKVFGNFEDLPAEEECEMTVSVKRVTCDRCSRMAGNYYEATVQVRGRGSPPSEEELKRSKEIAKVRTQRAMENGDQLSFIQDIKTVKGGIDVIVGSTQQGRLIAKGILDVFGGTIQESYKIVGKRDGKDIHRTNILARLPRFRTGDVVKHEGNLLEVTGFEGKRTIAIVFSDGKRRVLSEEKAEEAKLVGNRKEAKKTVVVAEDRDVAEVLDPESFKTVLVSKPRRLRNLLGQEVTVLRSRDELILLPSVQNV